MTSLQNTFQCPPAAYRGKPFWSWNGMLDEAELLRQLHVFKEMGFGGFFMHSRTGLITDYLGDNWFRFTNRCADEAAKLGMEAWLYDEDRWPSGTAGGLVTADPAFQQQFVSMRQVRSDAFDWNTLGDGELVAVFAAVVDGLNFSHCRRLVRGDRVRPNETVLLYTIEHAAASSFYNGNTYVDTMNRRATDAYLKITHDQYQQRCGDRLGKAIHGIFTDEPHRGPVMNGFSLSNPNRMWMTPWTGTLAAEFTAAFGYDLIDRLPDLFLRRDGQPVSAVKWQYMELLQRLFLKNFAAPMFDWCNAHNMQLTGHVLHEDSLTAQACMQGSLARFYEYMHLPGIDILAEGNRCYWVAKQLSSVARQLGQKWMLSELYGCTGWQMGFDGHKAVGDWQALLGINVRCHHLSWYTMEGEAKRDYPASISHQSAWWKDYRYIEDYFARMGVLLSHGKPCSCVLVVSPIESVWCQIRGGWAETLAPADESIQKLESQYKELFTWFAGGQIEFDYGDEEMMSRLCGVHRDRSGQAVLRFGHAEYRTIVIGGMTTIRSSTLKLLAEFAKAGGRVIVAGEMPAFTDAVPAGIPGELLSVVTRVDWNRDSILRAASTCCVESVFVQTVDGRPMPDVFTHLRRDEDGNYIVVVLNTDRDNAAELAHIRLTGAGIDAEIAEWDCATSRRYAVVARRYANNELQWPLELAAGGSRAYLIGSNVAAGLSPRPFYPTQHRHSADAPFRFSLTEPNVCVLDRASLKIGDGSWQPAAEILKVDRTLRDAFGLQWRSGDMIQPWLRLRTQPKSPVLGPIRLSFRFDVQILPGGPVELGIEQPHFFTATLNGRPLPLVGFAEHGWWIDQAIRRIALPADALRLGENELVLIADFHEDINLEVLYLLGEFGVNVTPRGVEIGPLAERLLPGDLAKQGLPFYGGGVRYFIPLTASQARPGADRRLLLELPAMQAACAKVVASDKAPAMLAWHPYRADVTDLIENDELCVEVTLTRRNTFGPLHQLPLLTPHYGPGNFTTEGDKWSDDFVLLPSGLLEAPVLVEVLVETLVDDDTSAAISESAANDSTLVRRRVIKRPSPV